MITYRFAENQNLDVVDISDMEREREGDEHYSCISCKKQLIPRIGKKRERHFAHKNTNDISSCSYETYLHSLAKRVLYDNIVARLGNKTPLYLEYKEEVYCEKCHFPESNLSSCFLNSKILRFDLLKVYQSVHMEYQDGEFRPDIVLLGKEDKLYIEIAVTHKSDLKKLSSNNKIIEINIESEDQIQHLNNDVINNDFVKPELYNFNFKFKHRLIIPSECTKGRLHKFIVYSTGKAKINKFTYFQYSQEKKNIIFEKDINEKEENIPISEIFVYAIEEAYEQGIKIKNCNVCRYHGYKDFMGSLSVTVFCKKKKEYLKNSNEAADCDKFKGDKNSFYSIHQNLSRRGGYE